MTDISNEWYASPAVAKALRSKTLKIEFVCSARGLDRYEVTSTAAYRAIYKAYDLAFKGGRIAESCGADWQHVTDILGLRVAPEMIVAAKIGAPYEWQLSPLYGAAVAALQEIEQR